ncbi:hypothetical protein B484DRAFT_449994 [Ochromonadaceae sp. CCMP2298]|nr:hypothetical protein B484DRAFT_449994 [Ochromonadaceae sp. CCMP2298]
MSTVLRVDDAITASGVIRALRSSSNSFRHYKQNATRDDYLIPDLTSFDKLVRVKGAEAVGLAERERQLNEAMAIYMPVGVEISPGNSPQKRGGGDSDCEGGGGGRGGDGRRKQQESDSDDEGVEGGDSKSHSVGRRGDGGPQHGQERKQERERVQELRGDEVRDEDDVSFLAGDSDEDGEFFRNFTAPSKTGKVLGNLRTGVEGVEVVGGSKGSLSKSIRYGAGGVRGIQHQLRSNSGGDGGGGMSGGMGGGGVAVGGVMRTTLNSLKPGQAIRVKAPSKKSRVSM